uniref:Uncharacterized protein n=1 Tax=Mesocestoides corti TaxID=53468 RepID=A0A5K3F4N0_MESCO
MAKLLVIIAFEVNPSLVAVDFIACTCDLMTSPSIFLFSKIYLLIYFMSFFKFTNFLHDLLKKL